MMTPASMAPLVLSVALVVPSNGLSAAVMPLTIRGAAVMSAAVVAVAFTV
jgi:hypothetical protein